MKILLVDDDQFVRTLLLEQLSSAGFKVTPENNVDDAIKILEKESFDLLITDIVMPHKDGAALMKYVKENAANLPILAITAGVENAQQDYLDYADFYADATLMKPIKKDELIATVKRLVS